MLHFGEER
jgi:hypothetical protein